jgi:hypothetical protein
MSVWRLNIPHHGRDDWNIDVAQNARHLPNTRVLSTKSLPPIQIASFEA